MFIKQPLFVEVSQKLVKITMKIKTILSLGFILLALTACDEEESRDKFSRSLDSWMGRESSEFINTYGSPTSTYIVPEGNRFLVYERGEGSRGDRPRRMRRRDDGERNREREEGERNRRRSDRRCRLELEVDRGSDKLVDWDYEGDDDPRDCLNSNR